MGNTSFSASGTACAGVARLHPSTSLGMSLLGLFFSIFLLLPAAAQERVPLPPQTAGLAWPMAGWQTGVMTPDEAAKVQPLIDKAMAGRLEDTMGETRAVVIVHHGRLVAEAYADGFGRDTKQISWSMAKSITSALVGRAVQLGLIDDLDAPMPSPFDEGDPRARITWRQWLNMTDGLDYNEMSEPSLMKNDVVQMMYGRGRFDVMQYIKDELPPVHPPGTVWNYSTAAFHLIGRALEQVSSQNMRIGRFGPFAPEDAEAARALRLRMEAGEDTEALRNEIRQLTEKSLAAAQIQKKGGFLAAPEPSPKSVFSIWVDDVLFAPLGMDAQIEFDSAGTYLGGSLVWASARDFAKFGYLYLRDGVWEGERLLPEGWVDFSRTDPPETEATVYGAGFWLTPETPVPASQGAHSPPYDSFSAQGHEGQTIWIVPSRDLVIVRLGLMGEGDGNWPALVEWNQEIARAFPASAIPEGSAGQAAPNGL